MKGHCGLTVLFYFFCPSVNPEFAACRISDTALLLGPSRAVLYLIGGPMGELSIETAARGWISHQFD
jgi:hypothetical protein